MEIRWKNDFYARVKGVFVAVVSEGFRGCFSAVPKEYWVANVWKTGCKKVFLCKRISSMGRLRSIWYFVSRNKYGIAVALFVSVMLFFDNHNLINRYHRKHEINGLRKEIEKYKAMYERDTRFLLQMDADPDVLTEIARERYFMKYADEDVFVISED